VPQRHHRRDVGRGRRLRHNSCRLETPHRLRISETNFNVSDIHEQRPHGISSARDEGRHDAIGLQRRIPRDGLGRGTNGNGSSQLGRAELPSILKTTEVHPLHEASAVAGTLVDARDGETAPFDFTAAIDWLPGPSGPPALRPGAGIPVQSDGPPTPPSLSARFRPGLASPLSPPPPSTRRGCEEGIDRLMGAAGYLKSKIRLQGEKTPCGSGLSSPRHRRPRNCASSARHCPHSPRRRPIFWSASIVRKSRLRSASNSSVRSTIPYPPSTNPSPRISVRCSPSGLGLGWPPPQQPRPIP
jgi:hypothetical protein